jgi:hypothetical protein
MHGSVVLPSRPKVAEIASRFSGGGDTPVPKKDTVVPKKDTVVPKKESVSSSPMTKKESTGKKADLPRASLPLSSTSTKVP